MTDPGSRRDFLRGRFSKRQAPQRPPWAVAEEDFLRICSRCGDCAGICPTHIVVGRQAAYPTIDFGVGECTFCGDCAKICTTGALQRSEAAKPWLIGASIGESCLAMRGVECRICGEQCDAGAIRFRPQPGGVSVPLLDEALCSGCGACVASCPTRAVSLA